MGHTLMPIRMAIMQHENGTSLKWYSKVGQLTYCEGVRNNQYIICDGVLIRTYSLGTEKYHIYDGENWMPHCLTSPSWEYIDRCMFFVNGHNVMIEDMPISDEEKLILRLKTNGLIIDSEYYIYAK